MMGSVDFQKWINELREMPIGASQWEFASQFIEEMTRIVAKKEIERNRRAELVGAIGDVTREFSDELEFLKLQEELSSLNTASSQCDVENVLEVIESLKASLVDYKAAREMLDNPRDHESLIQNVAKLEQAAELSRANYNALNDLLEERSYPDDQQSDPAAEDEPSNTFTESVPEETEIGKGDNTCEPEDNAAEQNENGDLDDLEKVVANDNPRLYEGTGPAAYEGEHPGTSHPQILKMEDSKPANDGQDFDKASSETDYALEDVVGAADVSGDDNPASEGSTVTFAERTENTDSAGQSEIIECLAEEILGPASTREERRYGLEDSQAAANRYLKTSSLRDLESLMWSLVAEDDLSAAYWVARHLSEQNYKDVVTPELLKAVQGSRWLAPASNRYVSDLSEFVHEYDRADVNAAQELLELAASLHSSLIAPYSNMWGLLKTPDAYPSAGPIVSTFDDFARYGHALRPEYIEGMGESVRHQDDIFAASADTKSWLESAAARRYRTFQLATNVWLQLTGDGGTISQMLAPVKNDDRTLVKSVKESLEEDSDNLINRIGRSLADGPWVSITGRARNWLINGVTEANGLAERWCELVEYERDVQTGAQDRYLIEHVTNLRSEVQRQSNQFVETLCELITDSNPTNIASAAQCALRSMEQVLQSLDININVDIPHAVAVVRDLTTINKNARSHNLSVAVSRRLLWTDSVDFKDDCIWEGQSLDGAIYALAKDVSEPMPLQEVIQRRFDIQDFRFFEVMMEGDLTVEQKESLKNRCEVAQQDSLVTLESRVKDVEERVIQAVRDGVIEIDDDDWILYDLVISDIAKAVEAEDEILNYVSMSIQLQDIQEGIERLELQKQDGFQEDWDKLLSDFDDNVAPALKAWQGKFEAARDNRNIRVMEECVIRLNSHSLGEPLPDSDSNDVFDAPGRKALTEFLAFVDGITDIERYVQDSGGLASLQSRLGSS